MLRVYAPAFALLAWALAVGFTGTSAPLFVVVVVGAVIAASPELARRYKRRHR